MKKILIILSVIFLFNLYASADQNKTMPPPIIAPKKKMPSTCRGIPAMLLILPPPLEKDYSKCRSIMHKPSLTFVAKKIKGTKKVDVVDGFENLYKITTKNGEVLYCNESVSKCIENGKMLEIR